MLSTSSSKQRRGEAVPMPPDLGGDDDEEEATGTKGARCTAASPVGLERLEDLLAERSSPVSVERSLGELVSTMALTRRFPLAPVRLVRNPETVPMMADGSLLRSAGETWGPVSPDNEHETGVWSLDSVDSSS